MKKQFVAKAVSFITAATMVGMSLIPLTAGAVFSPPAFLLQWTTSSETLGLDVDSSNNVYTADRTANTISKWNSSGTFLFSWGIPGAGNGQFNVPSDVAVYRNVESNLTDDIILVADRDNQRIQKFDINGNYLGQMGTPGHGPGLTWQIASVEVDDANGNVYAVMQGFDTTLAVGFEDTHKVMKFNIGGTFLTEWGTFGTGNGQFNFTNSVPHAAVDGAGNVYVADTVNHRIQKFNSSGTYLAQWSTDTVPGYGPPHGLHFANGLLWVAISPPGYKVEAYDSNGVFQGFLGGVGGSGPGELNFPLGVSTDSSGNIYVTDHVNNRVEKWAPTTPPVSVCVQRALDDLGVTQAELGADFAELVNACDVTQTTIFSEDIETSPGVISGNVNMATPDDLLIVKSGTVVDGQIRGDGAQTVMLGSNVTVSSHLKNLDRLIFAGTGIFIGGHIKHNIKELALLDNASGTIDGELLVGKLEMGQNSTLTVTNKITINVSWLLETGSVLNGGSSLNCGTGSTGTDNGTVNVSGKNNCAPALAARALKNSDNQLAMYLPLLALAALGLAIYVRPRRA